jgi:hypothetical protein
MDLPDLIEKFRDERQDHLQHTIVGIVRRQRSPVYVFWHGSFCFWGAGNAFNTKRDRIQEANWDIVEIEAEVQIRRYTLPPEQTLPPYFRAKFTLARKRLKGPLRYSSRSKYTTLEEGALHLATADAVRDI